MENENTEVCCSIMETALKECVFDDEMRLWIGDTEAPFPHKVKFCPWCGAKRER